MSFKSQVARFHELAIDAAEDTIRATKIELFSSVILDTPVDEGRARGNWQYSENAQAPGSLLRKDPTGQEAINDMIAALSTSIADSASYLTNNLVYIQPLEEGHSGQAPAGMVRKNIARIQRIIREQAARFR